MNKELVFSFGFDITQVPEDLREKVRVNIDKWKQAYEELYQARIQELQGRINQLELELRHNQNWENYQKGLYSFQTYYMNLLSEINVQNIDDYIGINSSTNVEGRWVG